ncbi:FAD-dependent monooxygenase [Noviherbaspirillum sp. Root189]|uniref:FAD-dependent monooxygenase n=1 Tax=Noviherbaspirillum sp. Root189 TaxID=1736487 RepID=UPI00070D558D|nr:FAD-dependent monooxygenase [Noviherbaspirillum sp. Root189]KRB88922.1 monooxygenase [Noviherbaspirillum sp. Root189]
MHQPDASPRPSIYYHYQVYPCLPLATLKAQPHKQVVIAGAGPAGMTAALILKRMGVDCVILEAERQVSQGSRAIVFTRRSMEILQQAGVANRIMENGLPWHAGNSFYRGQRVFRMDAALSENDRFPPLINIQQQYLEEYLVDACSEAGIEIRWGNKIEDIIAHEPVVTLRIDTPEGEYQMQADWLIAADGARSAIRQKYGLKMEGDSYEGKFVIADIRIDLDYPTERLAFFDPSWNPGNTVLMHREPHGIWRIDYQLPTGESPEEALRPESLKARIDAQLEMIGKGGLPWEMDWCSVYSARAMTLPDYRHGHILFVGDAAHMLPIFGVRGANTAFQDAQNLAWKLALVCQKRAQPDCLETYSYERVGAAREIIQEGGRSTRFMTPPSHGFRLMRNATLSLALQHEFVRPLFHWRTSRAHTYTDSPINASTTPVGLAADVKVGAVMPNVKLGDGSYLLDYLSPKFVVIISDDAGSTDISGMDMLCRLQHEMNEQGSPFELLAIRTMAGGKQAAIDGVVSLVDPAGNFGATVWGNKDKRPRVFLVRPDQHIAGCWQEPDAYCIEQIRRTLSAFAYLH